MHEISIHFNQKTTNKTNKLPKTCFPHRFRRQPLLGSWLFGLRWSRRKSKKGEGDTHNHKRPPHNRSTRRVFWAQRVLRCSCAGGPEPSGRVGTKIMRVRSASRHKNERCSWKQENRPPQQKLLTHEAGTGSFPPRLGSASAGERSVRCRSSCRSAVRCVRTTASSADSGLVLCARAEEEEAVSFLGLSNSREERIRVII